MAKYAPTGASVLRGLKTTIANVSSKRRRILPSNPGTTGADVVKNLTWNVPQAWEDILPSSKVVHRRGRHYYPEPPYC